MPTLKRVRIKKGDGGTKTSAPMENQLNTTSQRDVSDENGSDDLFSQSTRNNHPAQTAQHESLSIGSAITKTHTRDQPNVNDVVGVVLSTTLPHNNTPNSKTNRVRVLIGDNSLPHGHCARVSISDCQLCLSPGDVVRFNNMEVRNVNNMESSDKIQRVLMEDDNDIVDDKSHNSLLKVVCDLYPSWKELTTGPTLTRLCHIHASLPPSTDESNNKFNLDWENEITQDTNTPREYIIQLSKWYSSSKLHSLGIGTTSQPPQRRKLRDITINTSSHIVVRVLRCEKATPKWTHAKIQDPYITHAILSDGPKSEDIMGLGGSMHLKQVGGDLSFIPKSISAILLQSLTEGCYILLTHVRSKCIANTTSLGERESLMLIPTIETITTVITPEHPFFIKNSPCKENVFASQPITLERASQLYSMSQQCSPSQKVGELQSSCRGMMAIVSPLRDILVDGIFASFLEGRYWQTNQSLSKFLIDTPTISTPFKSIKLRPTYRSATIQLDPEVFSKDLVINADGDALKLLCMDVPAEDMVDDGEENPYLAHVGALLRGLCKEKTLIRWVLEQESESNWFVLSASLIKI